MGVGLTPNIFRPNAVFIGVMMNDLLQIQKDLGAPPRESRQRRVSGDDMETNEDGYDPKDWLAMPVNHCRYHKGYTTNHWLSVFRAINATG